MAGLPYLRASVERGDLRPLCQWFGACVSGQVVDDMFDATDMPLERCQRVARYAIGRTTDVLLCERHVLAMMRHVVTKEWVPFLAHRIGTTEKLNKFMDEINLIDRRLSGSRGNAAARRKWRARSVALRAAVCRLSKLPERRKDERGDEAV